VIERIEDSQGVVYYGSTLLRAVGVPHAFSTRLGGVSRGVFDSLNLGNPSGCPAQDAEERIQENYRRLQLAAGFGSHRRRGWVHQVHGNRVAEVEGARWESGEKADALVSGDALRILAVRVADCVPVLVARTDGRRVAAIHAGWRGVVAGVVGAAMERLGPGEYVAAVGPCIGMKAFEVGEEVVAAFEGVLGKDGPVRRMDDGKGRVDLREAVRKQLIQAGVGRECIDVTDRCTVRDREEFFSHRRDAGVTGRMAALIAAGAVE
jgi:YfiH family protein